MLHGVAAGCMTMRASWWCSFNLLRVTSMPTELWLIELAFSLNPLPLSRMTMSNHPGAGASREGETLISMA